MEEYSHLEFHGGPHIYVMVGPSPAPCRPVTNLRNRKLLVILTRERHSSLSANQCSLAFSRPEHVDLAWVVQVLLLPKTPIHSRSYDR